jgi:uncharacterized protein YcbK (DUF882 family)
VTDHFTLDEFLRSETAKKKSIKNQPSPEVLKALLFTACGMERIRAACHGHPVRVNSGFRSLELNEAVGGSKGSQHIKGEACDFVIPRFGTPLSIAKHLQPMMRIIGIDQLILEGFD